MHSLHRENTPCRQSTPWALKRHTKWFWIGSALGVVGFWGGFLAAMVADSPRWLALVGPLGVAAFAGGIGGCVALTGRDQRRVRALGGRACPRCLYDLSTLGPEGACPECGTPFTRADIVRRWRNADRSYRARELYTFEDD